MKRYPAYEFPEYVNWTEDPSLIEAYHQVTLQEERSALIEALTEFELLEIYRQLVTARLHDIQLKRDRKSVV